MSETGRCRVHMPEGATPKDGLSARRRHGHRDRLRDGRHSGAPLTLFASPNGDRLFFIQMAKNREFSRPNREFKFRSCFGPAFGSCRCRPRSAPAPWPASLILRRRSPDRHGRGVDYSIALVERLSAFFIMLIGFEWVRPRLTPGT